jgi:malto-oligosyltrehalose trehalohydrolase
VARDVHLVLENHDNRARWLGPPGVRGKAEAQWNDDVHHCLHVLCTGEVDGYYADYAAHTHERLARGLAEGFVYQGEPVPSQGGLPRGEPSGQLPATAFVNFLQNHDQVGNRAFGERLGALVPDDARLRAVTMIVLLAPAPPLVFMGEEWCAPEPFTYFCDFEPDLAARVREGRKREFETFGEFSGARAPSIPDPTAVATFERVKLDRARLREARHREWHGFYRGLLQVRRDHVVPLLPSLGAGQVRFCDGTAFGIDWSANDGRSLHLVANLGPACDGTSVTVRGDVFARTHAASGADRGLAAWSVTWWLEPGA